MWPLLQPYAFMPVPLWIEKFGGRGLEQAKSHGYNERLSRINLYAPAHNKPFPFKSSKK
jgi:hypothetical protein